MFKWSKLNYFTFEMTLKVPLFSVALLYIAFDRPWCSVPTCLSLHNWGWLLLLCLHEDIAMITSPNARVITFSNWRRIWWSKVIIALHYPFQILYKSITLIHMKTLSRTMYKLHAICSPLIYMFSRLLLSLKLRTQSVPYSGWLPIHWIVTH